MSKSVIDEALADARQLKELAEENAKRALIEQVTPRIKQLIESRLLGEADDSEESDDITESEDEGDVVGLSEGSEFELNSDSLRAMAPLLKASSDLGTKLELKVSTLGESVQRACRIPSGKRTNGEVTSQISELFSKIEDTYSHVHEAAALDTERKVRLEQKLESYYADLNEEFKEISMKKRTLSEADDMTADGAAGAPAPDADAGAPPAEGGEDVVITLQGLKDVDAESLNVDVSVETEDDEEGKDDDGAGAPPAGDPGAGGGDDVFAGMGEGLDMDEDTILEISDADLRREVARMRRMNESDSDVGKPRTKGGKIPVDDFGGGKDDGDPWLDHDVTTAPSAVLAKPGKPKKVVDESFDMAEIDEMDEVDESEDMDEADDMAVEGQHDNDQEVDEAAVVEVEMDEAEDMEEGDVVECGMEEMDEGQLSESAKRKSMIERQLKAEKARQNESQKKISGYKTEARKCRGTVREAQLKKRAMAEYKRIKESQTKVAQLQGSLKKVGSNNGSTVQNKLVRENKALKKSIAEVNLFNAKLLYANKLLQTEGLSIASRNRIIDALDAVQSLREAKETFTKFATALKARKAKLAESASPNGKVLGSASRVGKSAGVTLNESADSADGVELDRWQTLAGLGKK